MTIFEESLNRGVIGEEPVNYADIGTYALFGNMIRCLPDLESDLLRHAPGIHALCKRIGAEPSLERYVANEEQRYGKLYCGGQIEESIRNMLEMDTK
jgi:glutathione S-transferase